MCEGKGPFGLAFGTPDGQGAVICVADLVSVLGVVKVHAAFPSDIVAKQDSSVPVEDWTLLDLDQAPTKVEGEFAMEKDGIGTTNTTDQANCVR